MATKEQNLEFLNNALSTMNQIATNQIQLNYQNYLIILLYKIKWK